MQILIPDSWLREYLETNATPKQIQEALSLCGPSVERLHKKDDDYVYDIEVTTNRVDMMSVIGIAFECVAILPRFEHTAKLKKDPYLEGIHLSTAPKVSYLKVKVDKNLCDRFSAVLIRDVKVGKSPELISKRLELAGLRSVNNVVDISNYLMLEMGQPVHTFDYDKIHNAQMVLRASKKGERIKTLDEKQHVLPGGDIVIEDGSGEIIDLCGIMGGVNSAVDDNTKNVLLFVQVYEPSHIRKTSMYLAHRTGAAVLFEKGLPVENVLPTLEKGLKMFGGSKEVVLDILNVVPKETVLKLKTPLSQFVNSRLGINLGFAEIAKILKSLEFVVRSEYEVEVPWVRRSDVTIPEDLVEEVARIYGYHNLPSRIMEGPLPLSRNDKSFYWEDRIKQALKFLGFTETYTYSLVEQDKGLKLKNPLSSEWAYLRTRLAPSLAKVMDNNLKLFEIANVYLPKGKGLPKEELHLAIAVSTDQQRELKGVVETIFNSEMGVTVNFNTKDLSAFPNCIVFEINFSDAVERSNPIKTYVPISSFPPIVEDVNVTLEGDYNKLIAKIKKVSSLIKQIELIDKYENKLTLRITYHSDTKQLSSADVAPIRSKLNSIFQLNG